MNWSDIKTEALIKAARHCCVCHRYAGLKIEVHHINPKSKGGEDSLKNAIALCFDCHTDAGHYNTNHPRGTKFSSKELIRARDTWHNLVIENKIRIPLKASEHIHFRHHVIKNTQLALSVLNGTANHFPIENALFVKNDVFQFAKQLFSICEHKYAPIIEFKTFQEKDDVLNTYSDIKPINKSEYDYPYYTYERIPSKDELISIKNEMDPVQQFLLSNNVPIHQFAKSLIYEASGCGDYGEEGSYVETIVFRNLWLSFLAIENQSDYFLDLTELIASGTEEITRYTPFNETAGEKEIHFNLPKAPLKPKETVLIPTAIICCPFGGAHHDEAELKRKHAISEELPYCLLTHSFSINPTNTDYFLLGKYQRPTELAYQIRGQAYQCDIHELDLNNLYSINEYWDCGSCPHLFFQYADEKWYYIKELFAKNDGSEEEENFVINNGVKKIRIAELENEITFIQSIKINNTELITTTKMIQGDELEFDVQDDDVIHLKGRYQKLFENIPIGEQPIFRNEIIGNYLRKCNEQTIHL